MRFCKLYFLLLFTSFLWSCKKDSKILGTQLQPEYDVLNASHANNLPVWAYTKRSDSAGSANTVVKYLGTHNDAFFGKTEIGLYLNANMSVSNFAPGNAVLDSARIVLAYDRDNSLGNIDALLSYSVYAIDSALNYKRLYYTNNKRLHRESRLINTNSIGISKRSNSGLLRIAVDNSFGTEVLSRPEFLKDNDAFQAQYKGFYIKCAIDPSSEKGAIYRCLLDNELSGFILYYRVGSETKTFQFTFTGAVASRFNTVTHDYSTAASDLKLQLQGDTTAGNNSLFLQGMGSTRIRVHIPSLKNYTDSFKVAVNRAELIFNIDPSFKLSPGAYSYPTRLTLLPVDSLGRETYALDQINATDLARYDGYLDLVNNRYVFNIARHVQGIMNGTRKNYGFYLVMADPDPIYTPFRDNNIERVVFYGSAKGSLKPTFNFSYLKFPKD